MFTSQYYQRYRLPVIHTETNLPDAARSWDWLWKQWMNLFWLLPAAGGRCPDFPVPPISPSPQPLIMGEQNRNQKASRPWSDSPIIGSGGVSNLFAARAGTADARGDATSPFDLNPDGYAGPGGSNRAAWRQAGSAAGYHHKDEMRPARSGRHCG